MNTYGSVSVFVSVLRNPGKHTKTWLLTPRATVEKQLSQQSTPTIWLWASYVSDMAAVRVSVSVSASASASAFASACASASASGSVSVAVSIAVAVCICI